MFGRKEGNCELWQSRTITPRDPQGHSLITFWNTKGFLRGPYPHALKGNEGEGEMPFTSWESGEAWRRTAEKERTADHQTCGLRTCPHGPQERERESSSSDTCLLPGSTKHSVRKKSKLKASNSAYWNDTRIEKAGFYSSRHWINPPCTRPQVNMEPRRDYLHIPILLKRPCGFHVEPLGL